MPRHTNLKNHNKNIEEAPVILNSRNLESSHRLWLNRLAVKDSLYVDVTHYPSCDSK